MKRNPSTDAPNFFSFARDYLHTYMPTVRGLSPRTIEAYRISLECFLSYLADHDNVEREHVSFDHFDRRHLKAWLAWMVDDRHYASKTIALSWTRRDYRALVISNDCFRYGDAQVKSPWVAFTKLLVAE
jgi:site-specific recombinase XerD